MLTITKIPSGIVTFIYQDQVIVFISSDLFFAVKFLFIYKLNLIKISRLFLHLNH